MHLMLPQLIIQLCGFPWFILHLILTSL